MRIVLVHNFYQQPGGEDQVFAAEARLLEEHGHEVLRYTVHNREVERMGKLGAARATLWNAGTRRSLEELLRRERPAVVHFHNTFPLVSPSAYYAARAAGVPVVQTLHNYRLLCPNGLLLRDGRPCEACVGRAAPLPGVIHGCYRGDRAATGVVAAMLGAHRGLGTWARAVDLYLALTEFARPKFVAGGIPADRLMVKPHFVAPDPGVGEHRGGYALFAGRLSPEKGVATLLRAWERIGGRLPLKVVGGGPLETLLAPPSPGVEWLGSRTREEVMGLMRDATLLVMPSECYEAFGLTLVEAFATGLPVVASRLGAMAELVREGETGLLFEAGDPDALAAAVTRLLDSPGEREAMGAAGRREYEARYTAERNYPLLMEAYRRAALGPSPGSP